MESNIISELGRHPLEKRYNKSLEEINLHITETFKNNFVSKITSKNIPFKNIITPEELLVEKKHIIDRPAFQKDKVLYMCSMKILNIKRNCFLNKKYQELNKSTKSIIKKELRKIIKNDCLYILSIMEKRFEFIVSGYVYNYINYLCRGVYK